MRTMWLNKSNTNDRKACFSTMLSSARPEYIHIYPDHFYAIALGLGILEDQGTSVEKQGPARRSQYILPRTPIPLGAAA